MVSTRGFDFLNWVRIFISFRHRVASEFNATTLGPAGGNQSVGDGEDAIPRLKLSPPPLP